MQTNKHDFIIIGAGGAGITAAITLAKQAPKASIAVLSKVYPMRSHTVAAEGGAAGVKRKDDHPDNHFHDTIVGSDWLADQDATEYFVTQAAHMLTQMEHWGCPWSRNKDGRVATRAFGGMKKERTWFAADKSGFHMLHTLYQTSLQFPQINYFNEYYVTQLITDNGQCYGCTALALQTGEFVFFQAKSVIMATGGAGQVFAFTTNAGTNTGDGMALAYRAGAPLKDMEFVQYHPTALPNTGILITEAARGEGGLLTNKDGYRYLQDYGLGPAEPFPRKKAMELGPRDKLSQAFWHEQQKGRTIKTSYGDTVYLDIRHLGEKTINARLPMIRELARMYSNIDPVYQPLAVRPAVHYTMGGIHTNIDCQTSLEGLYAIGECACVSINGANRLGSNSLTELLVFGEVAGRQAAERFHIARKNLSTHLIQQANAAKQFLAQLLNNTSGNEKVSTLVKELQHTMEQGLGIYRTAEGMQASCNKIAELKQRYQNIHITDKSKVFNTEFIKALELSAMLDVAEAMAHAALARKESRGSHQRLDNYNTRDDKHFLKHTLIYQQTNNIPKINYLDVVITKLPPAERIYGGQTS